jgi:hypothetical protein
MGRAGDCRGFKGVVAEGAGTEQDGKEWTSTAPFWCMCRAVSCLDFVSLAEWRGQGESGGCSALVTRKKNGHDISSDW